MYDKHMTFSVMASYGKLPAHDQPSGRWLVLVPDSEELTSRVRSIAMQLRARYVEVVQGLATRSTETQRRIKAQHSDVL
jgi:hypothetical protein